MSNKENKPKLTMRKQQALATKEKIFNTAFRLITEKGFDNITVEQICNESGVAKGSFYHYFSSKDDIVIETYKIVDKKYSDEVLELPPDTSCFEKILATVGFQAKYANEKGVAFVQQIYKSQLESGTNFFISKERPYFKILKEIIEDGIKKNEIKTELSAMELTRWIVSLSRGITYDWCLHNGNYDIESAMDRVFRIIIKNFQNHDN